MYDRICSARATTLRVDAVLAAIDSCAMLAAKALLASRLQAADTPGAALPGPWSSFLIPLWCASTEKKKALKHARLLTKRRVSCRDCYSSVANRKSQEYNSNT